MKLRIMLVMKKLGTRNKNRTGADLEASLRKNIGVRKNI
jgi:hypothetical protein